MKRNKQSSKESGQTLIALLMFMMITIMLTTVAVTVTVINIQSNIAISNGQQALTYAESGAENALLQLLRDPDYTGETITHDNGTVTISVSGTTVKTIVSEGESGNHHRTVTVTASYIDNVLTPTEWSETP